MLEERNQFFINISLVFRLLNYNTSIIFALI